MENINKEQSIPYLVGKRIAEKFVSWDLEVKASSCADIAEKEGWNFNAKDWKEFYVGVRDGANIK